MEQEKETVLIVDDEPTNVEFLHEILGNSLEILVARNGRDALKIAAEKRPDLILLDIVLPDLDGYEVCTCLKTDSKTQDIPVIFVTALDQEENETKGLGTGAIDYITKPFSPPIVLARVRNHLTLKRYQDLLQDLSETDGLTGIPNSRRFDKFLDLEWKRAARNQVSVSLVLMDIDFFKAFNDHYGHLAGDDCLRQVASALRDCARRPGDLIARFGGEEFACLMPETDINGALVAAERIRESIRGLHISHAFSAAGDHVTLSFGVAATVPTIELSSDLIKSADECLYRAKQNGRNQIASPSGPWARELTLVRRRAENV